ncbi:MAG: c-type cytochrome [Candidatus Eremiobacteraeota bacterium]|nr:c-type cytochrome [Candidatus Eremiobacteraeota bacterium]
MIALLAATLSLAVVSSDLDRRGADLYAVNCVTCHGADLGGTANGPSLQGVGADALDFYLSTGRMPLEVPGTEPLPAPPLFGREQISALIAYVLAHGGDANAQIPQVRASDDLARGRVLFEENCQACHGARGDGAVTGFGWIAPPLNPDDPTQVAEAVRIGPGIMPRFGPHEIDGGDLDALVAYVVSLRKPPDAGGFSVGSAGPVGEGLFAWIFGVGGGILLMLLVGETLKRT